MNYRQPFKGEYPITLYFGEKFQGSTHTGIDYACPVLTPILASNNGRVFYAAWKNGGYGYCVFLTHSDGNTTIYEHLVAQIPVSVGQVVQQGEVIGYSGSTGNSTGPHLHFEIRDKSGKAFDPMTVLMTVDDSISQPTIDTELKDVSPGKVQVICDLPANVRDYIDHNRINGQKKPGDIFEITEGVIKLWGLPYHRIIPQKVDDVGGLIAAYDSCGTQMLRNVEDDE